MIKDAPIDNFSINGYALVCANRQFDATLGCEHDKGTAQGKIWVVFMYIKDQNSFWKRCIEGYNSKELVEGGTNKGLGK